MKFSLIKQPIHVSDIIITVSSMTISEGSRHCIGRCRELDGGLKESETIQCGTAFGLNYIYSSLVNCRVARFTSLSAVMAVSSSRLQGRPLFTALSPPSGLQVVVLHPGTSHYSTPTTRHPGSHPPRVGGLRHQCHPAHQQVPVNEVLASPQSSRIDGTHLTALADDCCCLWLLQAALW
jgi:hypothetical protein